MNGENNDGTWQRIGTHSVRFDSPDVIVFRANGDITVDDVRTFILMFKEVPKPENGYFYLSNLTKFGTQTAQSAVELRKLLPQTIRATAVIGATFRHKVLVDIFVRTFKFIGIKFTEMMPVFFDTEEEAFAWFDKLRKGER